MGNLIFLCCYLIAYFYSIFILLPLDEEDFGISDTYMPMSSSKRKLPFGGRFKSSSTPTASAAASNPPAASNSATKEDAAFTWTPFTRTASTAASISATVSNSTTEMDDEGFNSNVPPPHDYAEAFNSLQDAVSNSADQPTPQPMVTSTDGNGANCSEADSVSIQETDENNETL